MKTNSIFYATVAMAMAAMALTGCNGSTSGTQTDFLGTYHAVMPAADCPGISTTIILDSGNTYIIEREYLERASAYREAGKFTAEADMLTLVSNENDTTYIKVAEGMLKWLDNEKNEIKGDLADSYVFKPVIENQNGMPAVEITGNWVEPVPGMPEQFQGMSLMEDGTAQSINMATLQYETWDKIGNVIFLKGKSLGNGQTIEFTDTLVVASLTADTLKVTRNGQVSAYARQK